MCFVPTYAYVRTDRHHKQNNEPLFNLVPWLVLGRGSIIVQFQELHRRFLEQYFQKCNYNYGAIPDDSYVFYNFGYHLFKSEQFELFPQIYLDLSFVEAMLKANGPVDLLNDYRKYEEHIMGPVGNAFFLEIFKTFFLHFTYDFHQCLWMSVSTLSSNFLTWNIYHNNKNWSKRISSTFVLHIIFLCHTDFIL